MCFLFSFVRLLLLLFCVLVLLFFFLLGVNTTSSDVLLLRLYNHTSVSRACLRSVCDQATTQSVCRVSVTVTIFTHDSIRTPEIELTRLNTQHWQRTLGRRANVVGRDYTLSANCFWQTPTTIDRVRHNSQHSSQSRLEPRSILTL